MTLPFAGHPTGAHSAKEAKNAEDQIESAYRFLLADLMPFGKNALIQLEHGGTDESTEHYRTVTYWYGLPAASLVRTDSLQIGDAASERQHRYESPDASAPYEIRSIYEVGVDRFRDKVIVPPETDTGRKTTGASEFTLKIDPANYGVMLRRKLDYSLPNQRAEVFVADAAAGLPSAPAAWKSAGIWYLAGANTCVYSNPKDEARSRAAHDPHVEPPLPRRRVSVAAGTDQRPLCDPRARRIHAGTHSAFSGPPRRRTRLERDSLRRLLLRHARFSPRGEGQSEGLIFVPK